MSTYAEKCIERLGPREIESLVKEFEKNKLVSQIDKTGDIVREFSRFAYGHETEAVFHGNMLILGDIVTNGKVEKTGSGPSTGEELYQLAIGLLYRKMGSSGRKNLSGWIDKLGLGKATTYSIHEVQTTTMITEPLIEVRYHYESLFDMEKNDSVLGLYPILTVLMPHWGATKKAQGMLVKQASKSGPVMEFLWKKEAISADVDTTAESYYRMIEFLIYTLERYEKKGFFDHTHYKIRIVTCSAGIPVVAKALTMLWETHSKVFGRIGHVVFVGMADDFAECYMYGERTKHIGAVVKEHYEHVLGKPFDINYVKKKFAHMAPIKAIPALEAIDGKVTWITSKADLVFPLKNQRAVWDEIKRRGSKIERVDVKWLGHSGLLALYYLLGAGLYQKKSATRYIVSLLRKKFAAKTSGFFDSLRPTSIFDRLTDIR